MNDRIGWGPEVTNACPEAGVMEGVYGSTVVCRSLKQVKQCINPLGHTT